MTEYSIGIEDDIRQANYTRDFMINMFANENMDGFYMWGFWDGSVFSGIAPIFNKDWSLKKSGIIYEDLVYNKWWTKNESDTTDKNGKASVRGFYGDYDITVSVDGKSKTFTVPFHKGYKNEVNIVFSDYSDAEFAYVEGEDNIYSVSLIPTEDNRYKVIACEYSPEGRLEGIGISDEAASSSKINPFEYKMLDKNNSLKFMTLELSSLSPITTSVIVK